MHEPLPKHLLFDYFDGKATALQEQWIYEWLRDANNQHTFYDCLDEWERLHPQFKPDVDGQLAGFLTTIKTHRPAPFFSPVLADEPQPKRIGNRTWLWVAAAVVALVIGVYTKQEQIQYQTFRSGYGEIKTLQLADGSAVTLNANSTLRVPRWRFGQSAREVTLNGEAEFTVTHLTNNRRFVVRTATDFSVEVLGTEFVLYARANRRQVVLNRGRVQVTYQPGRQAIMKPGDWLLLTDAGTLKRGGNANPALAAAWKEHAFTFDKTTLADIARMVREQFGTTVLIPDSALAQRQVSGVFRAEQPDELIGALADLLKLRVTTTVTGTTLSEQHD